MKMHMSKQADENVHAQAGFQGDPEAKSVQAGFKAIMQRFPDNPTFMDFIQNVWRCNACKSWTQSAAGSSSKQ